MKFVFKHLWILTLLMITCSAILLMSDWKSGRSANRRSYNGLNSEVYHFGEQQGRPAHIMLAMYNEAHFAQDAANGLQEGLKRAGLVEGKDFTFRVLNAQGDMSTLTAIMGTVNAEAPDLLFTISTPCLQAALRQVDKNIPVVFTAVADGVKAGAGSSEANHQKNVTGITTRSPFDEMAQLIKKSVPHVQSVGTLFTPSEVNSVLYSDLLQQALARQGIELVRVPVTSTAETVQSTEILCSKNIQAIAQISDNTTAPGIGQIVHKATYKNLPTFVFVSSQMEAGATACVARDFYDAGIEAAEKALRVLLGESPEDIPFSNTRSKKVIIDERRAAQFGMTL